MNQNPEQLARDQIYKQLIACGWTIQHKSAINLSAATGVAVREYFIAVGFAQKLTKIVQEIESRLSVADKRMKA